MRRDLDEEMTRQEREYERLERENRSRIIHGAGDFIGVVVGVVCILALVLLLISLINWLKGDIKAGLSLFMQ